MIHYNLKCADKEHSFEGWFQNSGEFDEQAKKGMLQCPCCGSQKIEKAIMAPNLAKGVGSKAKAGYSAEEIEEIEAQREYIEETCEDVGRHITEVVTNIYEGKEPDRPVRGKATKDERVRLQERGIPFAILPALKPGGN